MSRPRFLADHDFNEHILSGLLRREPVIEVVRVRDVGLQDRPDSEILRYASDHGLIVLSHDVNTMTAGAHVRLGDSKPMTGLFMVQQSQPVGLIIENLLLIWASSEAEEWRDHVCFLPL